MRWLAVLMMSAGACCAMAPAGAAGALAEPAGAEAAGLSAEPAGIWGAAALPAGPEATAARIGQTAQAVSAELKALQAPNATPDNTPAN